MRSDSSNLDVLRSMAVLFVVISHLPVVSSFQIGGYHTQALGLLGVLIFFVHTCLVLMMSLERQSMVYGKRDFARTFFVRRVFRIYPLSIVVVLLLLLTVMSFVDPALQAQSSLWVVVSNVLLINNFSELPSIPGALWSLPFEVQMYVLLPGVFILVEKSGNKALVVMGLLWLASVALVMIVWRMGLNYNLIKFIPCFLPGVVAFTLRSSQRNISPVWLFLYVIAVAILYPWAVAHGMKENVLSWPVCLVLGLIIPMCCDIESAWLKTTCNLIARYSYGIYLVHGPCLELAFDYFKELQILLQWVIFVGATIVLSYLAFHFVEKPGIKFGRRIARRVSLDASKFGRTEEKI